MNPNQTEEIIKKICQFVKEDMEAVCTAHDFFHIQRVVNNAKNNEARSKKSNTRNK